MDNERIADIVLASGSLEYTIKEKISTDEIKDEKLKELWREAKRKLQEAEVLTSEIKLYLDLELYI